MIANWTDTVCGKPQERMSPLTSHSDSGFKRSNISFKENKLDGVDLNSNSLDYCVRKDEGKILWFLVDCDNLIKYGPMLNTAV